MGAMCSSSSSVSRIKGEILEYRCDNDYSVHEIDISYKHTMYILQRKNRSYSGRMCEAKITSFKLLNEYDVYKSIHLSQPEFEQMIWKLVQLTEVNIQHPSAERDVPEHSDVKVKILYPHICMYPRAYKIEAGTRQYILTNSDALKIINLHFMHKNILY